MALEHPAEPQLHPGVEPPDVSHIVTEDDTPVDNLYSAKQQRLLVSALYSDYHPTAPEDGSPRVFLACANVGLFPALHEPPLVPDVFISLDVEPRQNLWEKRNRTYFFWEFGKPPEVVIEVVSNREGGELSEKKRRYARMRIAHYVVWDPGAHLGRTPLHAFELRGDLYVPADARALDSVHLGLAPWHGTFEGVEDTWLRWFTPDGRLLLTGDERAATAGAALGAERERAEAERERAEAERERAEAERERADRLARRLAALGVDPDDQ